MSATTFHPGMRVRLKEPMPHGARYYTLMYRRVNGWEATTADLSVYNFGHRQDLIPESQMEPVPTPWERYGRLPWRPLLKLLASVPLGWLLMHANRRFRTTSFYELKDQVLKAYGRPDGNDLQELPAKPCWECNGIGKVPTYISSNGLLVKVDTERCPDCHGTGEYAGKLYVQLVRRKLAWYTFHKPGGTTYDYGVAVQHWSHKNLIHGLIKHDPNPKWLGYWCRIALNMLFNFQAPAENFRPGSGPHFLKVMAQRAVWRVQYATAPLRRKLGLSLASDEDQLPF